MEHKTPKEGLVKHGRQRSFGRTSSRMSLAQQEKLDARLAEFGLVYTDNKVNVYKTFPKVEKLIVELGIGNGKSLYNRAGDEPENGFIGVEVYKNGLRSLVIDMENEPHDNLKISNDDARNVLEALPEKSVDELVVLYPDPWPKKRHNKKRIIQKEFLDLADRVIKEDGILFVATDIPDYAFWIIRETTQQGSFYPTAIDPIEWTKAPNWWKSTKYEQKALKLGRRPWYFTFARTENVEKSNTKCPAL